MLALARPAKRVAIGRLSGWRKRRLRGRNAAVIDRHGAVIGLSSSAVTIRADTW